MEDDTDGAFHDATPTPPGPDLISGLPAELKYMVVSKITNKKDLSNLCLMSKTWNDVAQPALWHAFEIPIYGRKKSHRLLDALANPACIPAKHIRRIRLSSIYYCHQSLEKQIWETLGLISLNSLAEFCAEDVPSFRIFEILKNQSRLTDLTVKNLEVEGEHGTPDIRTQLHQELALQNLYFASELHSKTENVDEEFSAIIPIIMKSPRLQKLSINITKYYDGPLTFPASVFNRLFMSSRSTPITELRLKGIDLTKVNHSDLTTLSFDALRVLHLEECTSTAPLLDSLAAMHRQLQEQKSQAKLEAFAYVTPQHDKPEWPTLRSSLKRFLSSFSSLHRLTIVCRDDDYTWLGFELFELHASTLEFLLFESEAYPLEDLKLICTHCEHIEQLGMPLPDTSDEPKDNQIHYENDEIPSYLKQLARLPKLHTLRITSGDYLRYLNDSALARSCLLDLIRHGSKIQVCAVLLVSPFENCDYPVYCRVPARRDADGCTGEAKVVKVEYGDANLDLEKTSILGDYHPEEWDVHFKPL
ncbi:uncharacterized protein BDZ99DRAFT_571244 [Mytilinidion resinicola]|uniref:F-box domain-containing protein n=1 Tax=Mytilinidion resinicola TaxID=574789 RepID=A0A6A6YNI0_9PEZI|nr:uncharacterized protein BDZ99DRAFT_571244 [Mytilinidion resinicola]KAF2809417.1 hypothetical protein BDZ99DRAFT_571244 [Mytilinidion resinicola]